MSHGARTTTSPGVVAVVRHVVHLVVDDAQLHERDRAAGAAAVAHALLVGCQAFMSGRRCASVRIGPVSDMP